ncbi:MAG: hypothetical protein AMJ58_01675 [Gammaproteobacteria bacterium SG8_30]|nr:MAG: hypothetical protein AMJ58_01675 [Gammaproteobacteria bacterium SG8_30]
MPCSRARSRTVEPFKLLVAIVLIGIVASLGVALFHLVHDRKGETKSMVRALTVRISLSVALFILLFIAYAAGWIQPHGLRP